MSYPKSFRTLIFFARSLATFLAHQLNASVRFSNLEAQLQSIREGIPFLKEYLLQKLCRMIFSFVRPQTSILSQDQMGTLQLRISTDSIALESRHIQSALLLIMAHVGCFVPATNAQFPVIDKVLTKLSNIDDMDQQLVNPCLFSC